MRLTFGVDSKDEVMAKLKATAIIKKLNKPCLLSVDDYINKFLKNLSSVDDKVWPSVKETNKAFIDGFAPYSLKEAIKRSDLFD